MNTDATTSRQRPLNINIPPQFEQLSQYTAHTSWLISSSFDIRRQLMSFYGFYVCLFNVIKILCFVISTQIFLTFPTEIAVIDTVDNRLAVHSLRITASYRGI